MTNDNDNDKLRRLREWVEDCHRDSEQDGERAHQKQVGMRLAWRMVRVEIDRLLSEPASPAPAAAPSEAEIVAWRKEITDYIRALLHDKPIPGRGADRLLDEAVGLMRRAATAPAASPPVTSDALRHILDRAKALRGTVDGWPKLIEEIEAMATKAPTPVTSEAIEAAIEAYGSAWHALGRRPHDHELHAEANAACNSIRALIAAAIAEARGSSGLREAAQRAVNARKAITSFDGDQGCEWIEPLCSLAKEHDEAMDVLEQALAADAKEQTK